MSGFHLRLSDSGIERCIAAALVAASAIGCSKSDKAPDAATPTVPAACPDAGSGSSAGAGGAPAGESTPDATNRSPVAGTVLFAFDDTASIAAAQPSSSTQPGILNAQTVLSWDAEQGDPDDGSLRIEVPFSAYNQSIDFQFPLPAMTDLTGKVVYVRLQMGEGFNQDPSAPGGMIFYAQTGDDYAWGQAEWTNVEQSSRGKWREYAIEMAFPWREVSASGVQGSSLAFDPARVRLLGLIIHTGGGGSSTTQPAPAVFHVDSIGYWSPDDLE